MGGHTDVQGGVQLSRFPGNPPPQGGAVGGLRSLIPLPLTCSIPPWPLGDPTSSEEHLASLCGTMRGVWVLLHSGTLSRVELSNVAPLVPSRMPMMSPLVDGCACAW